MAVASPNWCPVYSKMMCRITLRDPGSNVGGGNIGAVVMYVLVPRNLLLFSAYAFLKDQKYNYLWGEKNLYHAN